MKKLIASILLVFTVVAVSFAAPKNAKSNNVKLDPKKKFAIEGVELGTFGWAEATVNAKGEIMWSKTHEGDWHEIGWDARGVDLSQYGAIRVELAPNQNQELQLKLSNPATIDEWGFNAGPDGVIYAFFNGVGKDWGNMKNPDLEEGFLIRLTVPARKYAKTVFKSVEFIKKEDIPDAADIEIMGVPLGSICQRETRVIGNELTWLKGYKDCSVGWDLTGIDLSEYDRIRIELESNTATNIGLRLTNKDWKNWYGFDQQVEQNVWEADLTGEGFSWKWDDSVPFDKSQGMILVFQNYHENPLNKDEKTVIKSVQLLKGKKVLNENLMIEGVPFGSNSYHCFIYDGGIIEWDSKQKGFCAGWQVQNIDFSAWDKLRVEIESSDVPLSISLQQQAAGSDVEIGFKEIKPNVFELNFDGTGYDWLWPQNIPWDNSKNINQILIHIDGSETVKPGTKTKIKSVTLLKDVIDAPQPENLMLNGAKLGSKRNNCWLDDDFAINWNKVGSKYASCGWKVEKLEGDIIEVKITSSDIPLRLRIRDNKNQNDSSWDDDRSHSFRINLKNKKQIIGKTEKEGWVKISKPFDFSEGAEIVIEPLNGVFKEGKKTVVEYIKVE